MTNPAALETRVSDFRPAHRQGDFYAPGRKATHLNKWSRIELEATGSCAEDGAIGALLGEGDLSWAWVAGRGFLFGEAFGTGPSETTKQ